MSRDNPITRESRVAMPRKTTTVWAEPEDLSFRMEGPKYGQRFVMNVSEDLLAKVGERALLHATESLAQLAVYQHQRELQEAVDKLLFDSTWLKPIIEHELRRCVREFVLSLWSDEEKKNQRDWFDLFAEKLK